MQITHIAINIKEGEMNSESSEYTMGLGVWRDILYKYI